MNARIAAAIVSLSLLLGGCVAFERAPVSKFACDPALTGRWQVVPAPSMSQPIVVADDCMMQWPEKGGGSYAMRLNSFALGDARYLAFTPEQADRLLKDDAGSGRDGAELSRVAPADSLFLVRYRIDRDVVKVWLPDPNQILGGIAAGDIRGRELEDKFAYVQGSRRQIAKLLRDSDRLYRVEDRDGVMQYRRIAAEAAP